MAVAPVPSPELMMWGEPICASVFIMHGEKRAFPSFSPSYVVAVVLAALLGGWCMVACMSCCVLV